MFATHQDSSCCRAANCVPAYEKARDLLNGPQRHVFLGRSYAGIDGIERVESRSETAGPVRDGPSSREAASSAFAGPQAGDFVAVRGKSWIVERAEKAGSVQTLHLVSCEDDSQGETIQLAFATELQTQVLDPNDWSPLLTKSFEGPQRLGAYLRSTEWRTATAADRKLFQAPFRAGIRLDSYQLLPLAKALELPRVNLLIADDVGLGKTVEAGLIVRELLLRRRIEMIVVAAPASMLLQWQDELAQKFGLDFTIVDREHLLETRRTRGFSANPWSVGSRFIVSHSVLSDETYMGGLRDTPLAVPVRARCSFSTRRITRRRPPERSGPWKASSRGRCGRSRRFSNTGSSCPRRRTTVIPTPSRRCSKSWIRSASPEASTSKPRSWSRSWSAGSRKTCAASGSRFPSASSSPSGSADCRRTPRTAAGRHARRLPAILGRRRRARFLFANLQQRLFSSIAAFHRTLTTHRRRC